jgi:hypothetical protein
MDYSALAELVDTIHVAVGLRLMSVVLFGPAARGEPPAAGKVDLLVIVEDQLPSAPAERAAYLARRTPPGTLDPANIVLRSPSEFDADPPETYREIANASRILLDIAGFASERLARIRAMDSGRPR